MRVRDDTMVDAEDEEVYYFLYSFNVCSHLSQSRAADYFNELFRLQVQQDEAQDEMASFFAKARCPKVLITTTEKPHGVRRKKFTSLKTFH